MVNSAIGQGALTKADRQLNFDLKAMLILAAACALVPAPGLARTAGRAETGKERAANVAVSDIRIDDTVSPLGLDDAAPTLSWMLSGASPGASPAGFQIQVASTAAILATGHPDMWNSGRVRSDVPRARYAGRQLKSRRTYFIRLRSWTSDGELSPWSSVAKWEMGLLRPADWNARWIRAAGVSTIDERYAGHYFRRSFKVTGQVRSARLYFAGWGLMRNCLDRRFPQSCRVAGGLVIPTINGRRLSDRELDSAPTGAGRSLYTTIDVTAAIRQGENVLGLSTGGDSDLIARLDIAMADGRVISVSTDGRWTTHLSPSFLVDRFAGTRYDARLEQHGWDEPGFAGQDWTPAEDSSSLVGDVTLSSDATLPPMRIVKKWKPLSVTQTGPGTYTLDFGQNITGRVHFKVAGRTGQALTITHAEALDVHGNADRFSTGFFGLQTDHYTFGSTSADWSPQFAYYGFRYATIAGLRSAIRPDEVWAEEVHTDLEKTGTFETSDPIINEIHRAAVQTTLNNAHGIPEDCPHREKRGWSADGYVSDPQALANFDMAGFYRKWLRDLHDAQRPDGDGTDIAPAEPSYEVDGDSTWASVLTMLPWDLYWNSGDLDILKSSYGSMVRFASWEEKQAKDYILPRGIYAGDWVSARQTDDSLLRTAIWYHVVRKTEDAARLLGHGRDAARFGRLARAIRAKFNATFLDRKTATYGAAGKQNETTSQASLAVPIAFGLVPDEMRSAVAGRLLDYIETVSSNHPESGLTATRYVLEALKIIDRPDIIHAMASQRDAPGWAFMVEHGPGTLWEGWHDGSHDHAWPGVIDAHFYRIYGGIDATSPGFRTVRIKPFVPSEMDWAKTSEKTPYGNIQSGWRKTGRLLLLEVTIPAGVSATIFVPTPGKVKATVNGMGIASSTSATVDATGAKFRRFQVGSGDYQFIAPVGSEAGPKIRPRAGRHEFSLTNQSGPSITPAQLAQFDLSVLADANGDGRITFDEFEAFRAQMWGILAPGADRIEPAKIPGSLKQLLAGIPSAAGFIERETFLDASPKAFASIDTERRGYLTVQQLREALRSRRTFTTTVRSTN